LRLKRSRRFTPSHIAQNPGQSILPCHRAIALPALPATPLQSAEDPANHQGACGSSSPDSRRSFSFASLFSRDGQEEAQRIPSRSDAERRRQPMNTTTSPDSQASARPAADWPLFFQAAPVALSIVSLSDGRLLDINQRFVELTGFSRSELIGCLAAELYLVESPEARERVAAQLEAHAAAYDVPSILHTKDGPARHALSSIHVVGLGRDSVILTATVDSGEQAQTITSLRSEAGSLRRQIAKMESVIEHHTERETRLVNQINGLCDQASMLKTDVIRLKEMQQELIAEIESLRKHTEKRKPESHPRPVQNVAPVTPAAGPSTTARRDPVLLLSAGDSFLDQAAARMQAFERQLASHVAALHAQAALLEAELH
jgi:PAS domain S-box-containing protein